MKKFAFVVFWIAVLVLNWTIYSYHLTVYPKDGLVKTVAAGETLAVYTDKKEFGIHQMILSGDPYTRGLHAGQLTKQVLFDQESALVSKLRGWVPSGAIIQGLILVAGHWFVGAEKYFKPWALEEMYGVSQSAPHEFDYLTDGFTRQVAYHGLHEVGQLMVDQKGDDMGCTVVATPYKGNWILGRNFDFEAGRVFDEDKIMKWVFPDDGNAYVSVIWAGMVGVVTGVNERGLYISINAAGTSDFERLGTPSTIVTLQALQFAKSLDEAIEIFKDAHVFITDIFVLMDAKSGRVVRIEKSPKHTEVIELSSPVVVTNHLISSRWENDSVNQFRRNELTSLIRETRGKQLVNELDGDKIKDGLTLENRILAILRDKGVDDQGHPAPVGDRRGIDSLIATHSVIYNGADHQLWVSQGPSLAGQFTGFDLDRSFAERHPVKVGYLARDEALSDQDYTDIHRSERETTEAEAFFRKKDCADGEALLMKVAAVFHQHSDYLTALGDLDECKGDHAKAKKDWALALSRAPAYAKEVRALQEKLK